MDTAQYYGFTGSGDSPDFVRDASWNISDKYLQLPGGVMVDIKPQQSGNAAKQYTLPSIEGRTLLTTDAAGTNTSTGSGPISSFAYDPFGNTLPGSTLPNNASNGSYGFGGTLQKLTETTVSLMPIQVGARVYFPTLGRFAQVDPIDGGTANRYVYVLDPVNGSDYSGMFGLGDIGGALAAVGGTVVHAVVKTVTAVVKPIGDAVGAVVNPTPVKSSTPYSGTASIPTGAGGKVNFKKMRVSGGAKVGKKTYFYSSASVGGNVFIGTSYGKIHADDGTNYHYTSVGLNLRPGIDASGTIGKGAPSVGCSYGISAFAWLGGSLSFPGPSLEFGAGTPGVSFSRTCVERDF